MITIMVENQPKPNARNKTTLIVVPSNVMRHWATELKQHTDQDVMRRVLVYGAGFRIGHPDVTDVLRQHDVIITSYNEVSVPREYLGKSDTDRR